MTSAKQIQIVILILSFPNVAGIVSAKPSEKDEVLRRCIQMFGPPVDEKLNLFEVDQFRVLRVKFDNRSRLEQLAVEPKYYFEGSHPEWEEPENFANLTKTEYGYLLARVDTVKAKGSLIDPPPSVGVVTNMTAWHKEFYEKGVLEWGEVVDLRRGENAPIAIRWFRLTYRRSK